MALRLFSKDLTEGGVLPAKHVFNGFGHSGENQSPQLEWTGAPEGTQSFALTMYDPDAPTGSGFWHWVVVDLPASATELPTGIGSGAVPLPAGARQTRTDMGNQGYIGAAPPPGPQHRYIFTLYALKVDKLPVPDDASGALIGMMTGMNALDKATLTVNFGA